MLRVKFLYNFLFVLQDELSSFEPIPGVDPEFLSPLTAPLATPTLSTPSTATPTSRVKIEDSAYVEDIEVTDSSSEVFPLTPPQSVFRGEHVHPMQLLVCIVCAYVDVYFVMCLDFVSLSAYLLLGLTFGAFFLLYDTVY